MPENLLVKVPKTLPTLTEGTGQDIVPVMAQWGTQYQECRIRQHSLIDAIRTMQDK